jgi:hypothetical protein
VYYPNIRMEKPRKITEIQQADQCPSQYSNHSRSEFKLEVWTTWATLLDGIDDDDDDDDGDGDHGGNDKSSLSPDF